MVASLAATPSQRARPALLAQILVDFPDAQASLVFRADTLRGPQDRSVIVGSRGTLVSAGPNINEQAVTLYTDEGVATPQLTGRWFPDGFDGTMSELLCAIEEGREPYNSAADNLASLELCFAAIASAETGRPVRPGSVTQLKPSWIKLRAAKPVIGRLTRFPQLVPREAGHVSACESTSNAPRHGRSRCRNVAVARDFPRRLRARPTRS